MKKIFNGAATTIITSQKTPLSVSMSIEQVGGQPLTQSQDTTQNLWNPDRNNFPLILKPILEVLNGETGEVYSPSATFRWYLDRVGNYESRTITGEIPGDWTAANGFYYQMSDNTPTGSLVVTKNINYIETWEDDGNVSNVRPSTTRGPVNLICVASYTDSAYNDVYSATCSALLTSENIPEDFYSVAIQKESPVFYRPLSDTVSEVSLTASVMRGKEILSGDDLNNIKFFWYLNDTIIPIDGSVPAYKSGQNTATLVLDLAYLDSGTIKVRIAKGIEATAPNIPAISVVNIAWSYPNIEAEPYCKAGSAIASADEVKEFSSLIRVKGQDYVDNDLLDKAERGEQLTEQEQQQLAIYKKRLDYLRFEWLIKKTNSTVATSKGFGRKLFLDGSDLYFGTSVNTEVKLNTYVLGALEQVTCNGEPVVITYTPEGEESEITENIYARK